jgi:ribonuclease P protein component
VGRRLSTDASPLQEHQYAPSNMSSASFHTHERIRHKREFTRVYEQGKKIRFPSFVLYLLHNQQHDCRLGITASKKIGNAVIRNRCKRLVRELFRRNKEKFPPGSDVVAVVTRNMVGKSYAELEEEFYSTPLTEEPPQGRS